MLAILFPNLSNTSQSLAGCPSSANNSSRGWKGVGDREESYCMGSKYRTQQGVDMPSDGDKSATFIAELLGRASPEERACLCVMGIYAGDLRGLKWHINPCDSQIICDHSNFMEVFKW